MDTRWTVVSPTAPETRKCRSAACNSGRRREVCKTVGSAYVGSNPTPATTCENGPLAAETRPWGRFLLCHAAYQHVSLCVGMLRCPRTYSGRRPGRSRGRGHRRLCTDGHGRARQWGRVLALRCGASAMRLASFRAGRRRESGGTSGAADRGIRCPERARATQAPARVAVPYGSHRTSFTPAVPETRPPALRSIKLGRYCAGDAHTTSMGGSSAEEPRLLLESTTSAGVLAVR